MHTKKRVATLMALCSITLAAGAAELKIDNPWARAPAPGQKTASAYAELTSPSDAALVSASSPAAERVELHSMTMDGGVMRMRAVPRVDFLREDGEARTQWAALHAVRIEAAAEGRRQDSAGAQHRGCRRRADHRQSGSRSARPRRPRKQRHQVGRARRCTGGEPARVPGIGSFSTGRTSGPKRRIQPLENSHAAPIFHLVGASSANQSKEMAMATLTRLDEAFDDLLRGFFVGR